MSGTDNPIMKTADKTAGNDIAGSILYLIVNTTLRMILSSDIETVLFIFDPTSYINYALCLTMIPWTPAL